MAVSIEDKVAFLKRPASYGPHAGPVTVIETHMSWVFLVDWHVFKLKKPIARDSLDLTTVEARLHNCREEVRLNRRLARDVYLDICPLLSAPGGALTLSPQPEDGLIVDWLVEMRRLPADRMLDILLMTNGISDKEVAKLALLLADFFRKAERSPQYPADHYSHFLSEQDLNRAVLTQPGFAIDHDKCHRVLDGLDTALRQCRPMIETRAIEGRIIEGHGDLRPEHICLCQPVAIFDCLEFDRNLRFLDPFDELAFLGMECARLGADWFGPDLTLAVSRLLHDQIPLQLFHLYTAFRAVLRARFSLVHVLENVIRDRMMWEPRADSYLMLAEKALHSAGILPQQS